MEAPSAPVKCANNCGFFGSPGNANMCSKCYRTMVLDKKNEQQVFDPSSTPAVASKGPSDMVITGKVGPTPLEALSAVHTDIRAGEPSGAMAATSLEPASSLKAAEAASPAAAAPAAAAPAAAASGPATPSGPKRCHACGKKVGLTGFTCRCGQLFCAGHRYGDAHGCTYDFKSAGRNMIAKANPVVRAEKVAKV